MGSTPILPEEYGQLKITPGAMENDLTEEPGFGAVMESMYRLEHPAASAWSYSGPSDMERLEQQEGFDSWNYIKGSWREDFGERYAGVFNTKAALRLDAQIMREQDDQRVVHASGWPAYLAALGATSLTDPFNFVPGGSIVRGVKTARAVGKSFLSTATAGAASVGASELILQETSETRTGLESAFSIAGGGLFAGFVGAGASAALSRADIAAGAQFFDDLVKAAKAPGEEASDAAQAIIREEMRTGQPTGPLEGDIPAARAGAAGAQARIEATPDDLTLAGGPITKFLTNITAFNPVLRANRFASTVAKGEIYKVIENPLMMRMHLRGDEDLAQFYGQNAENLKREWSDARAAEVVDFLNQAWRDHRKAGGTMKQKEFGEEASLAAVRGGKHADPHVQKVAENTDKRMFAPLFELAKNTYREDGTPLLAKDATVHNAKGYFTEMWRPLAIEAGGGRDFRAMMTEDVTKKLDDALARAARVRDQKVAAAQGKIDDLTATPDQYMQRLGDLRQQLDTLNTANPAAVQRERDLGKLRRQEQKARAKGDVVQADTLKNQIDQAAKSATVDNANYRTARNSLTAQMRRLRRGTVGSAERQEQLRNDIVDVEVDNNERLLRLHKQLGTLDQRMIDEGPEAHAQELSEIRTKFADVLESIEAAEERLATQQAKDREKLMTVADPEAVPRETAPPVDFDSTLDAIRGRPKRDPEKKMRSAPAIEFLKFNGGVKPGSPLAAELAKLGIVQKPTLKETRKLARSFGFRADDLRNLFREDGMKRADNLVPDRDGRFADMVDSQGYVDEAQLLEAVRSEIFGAPVRSPEELEEIGRFSEANQVADELEFELKDLGVDVRTMSNDEVLERLSVIQADTNRMREMYEGVPPRVSEDEGARLLGELEEEGRIGEPPERELTKGEAVITERMRRREQLFDMADRRKSYKLNKAAAEIERLQDVDPEAAMRALDELIAVRVSQTAGRVERAGVRIHSLLRRAERLDPKRVDKDVADLRARIADAERSFADTESIKYGEPGPDRDAYVKDIVEHFYHKLTDRENMGGTPMDLVMSKAGPLKERVFPFEQERYWKFMEHDHELVVRNYAKKVPAEIYLTKKLGSADGKFAKQRIEADYSRLVAEVDSHPKWSETRKEKERQKLNKEERRAKDDLDALIAMVRGVYKQKENSTGFARSLAVINTFNYLRIGGGFAIASLTDPARIMMTQGLGRFLGDAVVPLLTNLRGIKGSFEESKLAGIAFADMTNGTAMARMADLDDPWSTRSPFEALLMKASSGFSKLNGLAYWNAFMKGWAGGVIQNRIIHNVLRPDKMNAFERAYMNHMGLTGDMAQRIATQFQTHGEFIKRMAIANTDDWTDPIARMAYRAALRQDVNSTIVTKSIGDLPLFANTPLGRAAVQFKSFAMAGHQRAFLKGIQAMEVGGIKGGADSPVAGVLSAMITSTAIGSFIYYLKQREANRDISDNPARFLMEGLDRSGLYPILFEINNTFEKYFGVGAYAAANKMFPDAEQTGKASRYATRNMATTLLGPTGDTVETLGRVIMGIQRSDPKTGEWKGWTDGDRRGIRNLLPYSTVPVIKSLIEYGVMPQVTTPTD